MRKDGVTKYYEYVLLYTDDCLVFSDRAKSVLRNELGKHFELKESSIGPPSKCLGGKLREVELENGQKCWAFGSKQYVEAAVNNVTDYLKKRSLSLPAKCPSPMSYKLRMFGIPIEGPAFIFGDNQSVLVNSSMPESTLKRSHKASLTTLCVRGVLLMSGGQAMSTPP